MIPFPIRWLTYRRRITDDLKQLYDRPEGKLFFSKEYLEATSAEMRRLENAEIKLFIVQTTIVIFLIMGFLSREATISIFGVSLKDIAGVKELLLALSSSISVISIVVSSSKNTLVYVIEAIIEKSTAKEYIEFAKLGMPTAFSIKTYFARQYDRLIFSTFIPKLLFVGAFFAGIALFLIAIVFSIGIYIALFLDICRHPTLGKWSTVILAYTALTWIFGLFWLLRFYAPLPYWDRGPIKKS